MNFPKKKKYSKNVNRNKTRGSHGSYTARYGVTRKTTIEKPLERRLGDRGAQRTLSGMSQNLYREPCRVSGLPRLAVVLRSLGSSMALFARFGGREAST